MDERKLIYADDAIRWIKIECNPYGKPTLDFESGKKVIEYLERLPSVQPEHLVKESGNLVKGLVNDCISREDAIDAVKQHMNNVSGGNDEYYIAHRHIIELLQIVPTAQPESRRDMHGYRDAQRWIPVTEAFPEEDTDVLVTVYFAGLKQTHPSGWNDYIKPNYYVDVARYFDGNWSSYSDEYKVAANRHKVVAWMPLPTSYKEDEDARN